MLVVLSSVRPRVDGTRHLRGITEFITLAGTEEEQQGDVTSLLACEAVTSSMQQELLQAGKIDDVVSVPILLLRRNPYYTAKLAVGTSFFVIGHSSNIVCSKTRGASSFHFLQVSRALILPTQTMYYVMYLYLVLRSN